MWKKLLPLAAGVAVLAASLYLYRHRHSLFRPEFSRAGGTVLVYQAEGQPSRGDLEESAAALQRRFDPLGAFGILVQANADDEIEIRVPRSDKHDAHVDQVKRLIHHAGRFEVRVAARQGDDDPAIVAATAALKEPGARDKTPPPSPHDVKSAKMSSEFDYRYSWARLSASEVQQFRLDPAMLAHHNPIDHPRVVEALKTGEAVTSLSMAPNLLFAVRQPPGEKDPIYFLLTREEPPRNQLDGEHVERATVLPASRTPRPRIVVRFNREGGDRLFSVTSRNLSRDYYNPGGMNRLAVLLDGEVISTPGITAGLHKEVELNGEFTQAQAEDLAVVIRGGTCKVRLKPGPASVTSVEKK